MKTTERLIYYAVVTVLSLAIIVNSNRIHSLHIVVTKQTEAMQTLHKSVMLTQGLALAQTKAMKEFKKLHTSQTNAILKLNEIQDKVVQAIVNEEKLWAP